MILFIKRNQYNILSITLIFILFLIYNNKIVFNISTALNDWLDYPLMVFIQQENIKHIISLDFKNFANISMYFDSPGGLFFSDLLLPQSILGIPIYLLTKNFVTTHNTIFLLVGLLNIVSLQYFWSKIFTNKKTILLLNFFFMFSPYTLKMYDHYQMISYWFFFFSLGKLISAKTYRDFFIAGLLSGLQFLAGVYIGVYSITISGLFLFWKIIIKFKIRFRTKQIFLKFYKIINSKILRQSLLFILAFFIVTSYFLVKFIFVKNQYDITRSAEVYVNQSMQITDFLFNPLPSFWTQVFYRKINTHNHRLGDETFGPGFVLLSLVFIGMSLSSKRKVSKKQKFLTSFFWLTLILGIIAALGPRLSINGRYLATPLPYIIPLKLTPFFSALRVISRWYFVIQISFLFFVGYTIERILKHKQSLIIFTFIIFIYALEIIPITQRTSVETYKSYSYNYLANLCSQDKVVLEYPFTPEHPKTPTKITLNYWGKMLLNLMNYDCQLVNGYSGFQPKHISDFMNKFKNSIENKNEIEIKNLLRSKNITFVKFNKIMMLNNSKNNINNIFSDTDYKVLLDNSEYLIVMIK